MKIVRRVLLSKLMQQREMPYRLLLPEGYESFTGKYPVLYLLHGLFGSCDNWLELTSIAEYASGRNIAIVMPEGGDGWYTDSATVPGERYESYLTNELIPEVERLFPVSQDRTARGIAGLSMGGYGAFKLALKYPRRYCFAASISGAFEAPRRAEGALGFDWEILGPSVERAFGAKGSAARTGGDLFRLAEAAAESKGLLPYFYFDCGTQDGFLEINRRYEALLERLHIAHEYHEFPGGHDWEYWGRQVLRVLDTFEAKISDN